MELLYDTLKNIVDSLTMTERAGLLIVILIIIGIVSYVKYLSLQNYPRGRNLR